jgi:hypothetical protein
VSMSEERFPGDFRDANTSSFKVGLTVAGVVVGLAVLFCGGVAAYVAWTDKGESTEGVNGPAKKSPAAVQAIARKIVEIDIPTDFEPIDGDELPPGRKAVFGRKVADGALLKLRCIDLSMAPPRSDPRSQKPRLLRIADMGDDRTNTAFAEGTETTESTRELTVVGNPVVFRFLKGNLLASQKPVRKVVGAFTAGKSLVALIYTIPEEEYNEDAVVRLIASIRPPDGEGAAETDDATRPSSKDTSETNSDPTEKTGPEDDAPPKDDAPSDPGDEQSSSR